MPAKAKKTLQSSKKSAFSPPVVVVLGHVDHGKTTLLEAIRSHNTSQKIKGLTDKEHGGITQRIGAYQIRYKSKAITFIDTPGHEAFAKMRARGSQVADIAILVVAANEGVKPQTKEAISHIKAAKIPFIVGINKIDLPEASVDMVKGQLAENEILVEGYGGDVVSVPFSAKKGQGIDQLLEMILLVTEMQEIETDPKAKLLAFVLEAFLEPRQGIVANVLVKNGQLKLGDEIAAVIPGSTDKAIAKVKAVVNEHGKRITKAIPGQPVQILGFKSLPLAGAQVVRSQEDLTQKVTQLEKSSLVTADKSTAEAEIIKEEPKKLALIIKADGQGSLEAIKANLTEEVELVGEGVGDITESDVLLAHSTKAQLIGFNVRVPAQVEKLRDMEKVKIKTYTVIYDLLKDIQEQVLKMLEPAINEEILGEAEVIAEFKIRGSHIAGCKVKSGSISKKDRIRVMRGEEVLGKPTITSFQKERQEVDKVKKGDEVGIVFKPNLDFQVGDGIISYKVIE